MPDNTTTQTAAERLRASIVDARMFGEELQHNQYNGHYGSGVQIVRQAEQIRVLVEAITTTVEQYGWYESDTCGLEAFPWAENLLNALNAAWALEGDDA